jgi:hypothetical protein
MIVGRERPIVANSATWLVASKNLQSLRAYLYQSFRFPLGADAGRYQGARMANPAGETILTSKKCAKPARGVACLSRPSLIFRRATPCGELGGIVPLLRPFAQAEVCLYSRSADAQLEPVRLVHCGSRARSAGVEQDKFHGIVAERSD